MSKNCFFVLALEKLEITGDLDKGDKISNELYITNNMDIIREHTSHDFESIIGKLEYEHIFDCGTIVHGFHNIQYGNENLSQLLIVYNIRQVQNFLTSLWLSYDNAVDFNLGFLEVSESYKPPMISSNNIAVSYSNSKGLDDLLTLNREQLRDTRLNRLNLWGNFPDFSSTLDTDLLDYAQYNRSLKPFRIDDSLNRCFFYLNFARSETLLPVKISQYCICLECLFSTDTTELAHKVSERVAFFLESEGFNKLEVYNDVKIAYKIRSSVVHGSIMPKKAKDLDSISEKCDIYLRKSILKILNDSELLHLFGSKKADLENYLISICLGQNP